MPVNNRLSGITQIKIISRRKASNSNRLFPRAIKERRLSPRPHHLLRINRLQIRHLRSYKASAQLRQLCQVKHRNCKGRMFRANSLRLQVSPRPFGQDPYSGPSSTRKRSKSESWLSTWTRFLCDLMRQSNCKWIDSQVISELGLNTFWI